MESEYEDFVVRNETFRKLVDNTKAFAIGNIITKICQYLLITLCTYRLSTAEYGVADTMIQTAAILVPLFSCDIAEAAFRFAVDGRENEKIVLSNALKTVSLGLLVLFILLPVFRLVPFLRKRMGLVYVLTFVESFQACIKEYIRGIGRTKDYIIGGVVNVTIQISACLCFVYFFDLGLTGYILAISLAYIIEFLYYWIHLHLAHGLILKRELNNPILKKMVKYSVPLIPNTVMWWIIGASDRYFILWLLGESATGVYSVAAKFPAIITVATSIFFQAWEISAIEAQKEKDRENFYNSIFNTLLVVMGVVLGISVVLMKPLVVLMVAGDYRDAWSYSLFLLLAATFNSIQRFLGVNYTVAKDSVGALKSTTFAAVLNLVLNYVLIKSIGVQGATVATFISCFLVAVYRFLDTKKYIRTTIKSPYKVFGLYISMMLEIIVITRNPELYWISFVCGMVAIVFFSRELVESARMVLCNLGWKRWGM